jgi:branched-chain amino acid transport system permease protein
VLAFQVLEERIWSSFLEIHSGVLGLVIVVLVFCLPGGLLAVPYRDMIDRLSFLRRETVP